MDEAAEPVAVPLQYAFVEIMGHRSHWAEISDVERAGVKLLRVHDLETDEVHNYGGAAIFNIHEISRAQIDAHLADVARRRKMDEEREARWAAEREARALAKPALTFEPSDETLGETGGEDDGDEDAPL